MNIMITGASGFIGRYVLRFLLEDGHHVNALVRDPSKLSAHPRLKIFRGDIINLKDVNTSVIGCDSVIHLAALVRSSAQDQSEFFKINYSGTENLLKASAENNLRKFIFTSSMSAHTYTPSEFINEESLLRPEVYFSEYAEAKAKAEDLIIGYSKKGLSYIIFYPARVFGRGPLTDANGAIKALSLYIKNRLPFLIDGGEQYSSWAFVEDVARGIASAINVSSTNQKYILGGENKTLAEVYNLADIITGRKHLRINLKNKTALNLASVLELYAGFMRKHPLITRKWLSFVMESCKVSSEKAIRELNYNITPFSQALEKTITWLKH